MSSSLCRYVAYIVVVSGNSGPDGTYTKFRLSVNRCAFNNHLFCYLSCASLAVLEGFGEVVGFDDVGAVEVGDGSG